MVLDLAALRDWGSAATSIYMKCSPFTDRHGRFDRAVSPVRATIPSVGEFANVALGRLVPVDPRDVWKHEALNFTPWLALPENLALLGETLGIDLELEAQEKAVGPYRADLLCKAVGSDRWVLVENQLEKTDHLHLGQLVTYAAGLDAVSIVWISPSFTEEHRACLDWLNRITVDGVDFFGVEIEVWKIGESSLAPRFNLVSKPNEWSKVVAATAGGAAAGETAELYVRFWTEFREALSARNGTVKPTKAHGDSWMGMSPFGRGEFSLQATISKFYRRANVALYIKGKEADGYYRALSERRSEFHLLAERLTWSNTAKQDRTLSLTLPDVDPADETTWPGQIAWLCEGIEELYTAFAPILKTLQPVASAETEFASGSALD